MYVARTLLGSRGEPDKARSTIGIRARFRLPDIPNRDLALLPRLRGRNLPDRRCCRVRGLVPANAAKVVLDEQVEHLPDQLDRPAAEREALGRPQLVPDAQ